MSASVVSRGRAPRSQSRRYAAASRSQLEPAQNLIGRVEPRELLLDRRDDPPLLGERRHANGIVAVRNRSCVDRCRSPSHRTSRNRDSDRHSSQRRSTLSDVPHRCRRSRRDGPGADSTSKHDRAIRHVRGDCFADEETSSLGRLRLAIVVLVQRFDRSRNLPSPTSSDLGREASSHSPISASPSHSVKTVPAITVSDSPIVASAQPVGSSLTRRAPRSAPPAAASARRRTPRPHRRRRRAGRTARSRSPRP